MDGSICVTQPCKSFLPSSATAIKRRTISFTCLPQLLRLTAIEEKGEDENRRRRRMGRQRRRRRRIRGRRKKRRRRR